MPLRILDESSIDSASRARLIERAYAQDRSAFAAAQGAIDDVEVRGADAVREFTKKFDGVDLSDILVSEEEWARGDLTAPEVQDAFTKAYENILAFHRLQLDSLKGARETIGGTVLGFRYQAVTTAAMYVPGGKASYPSSVLMGLIPAVVAGVKNRIVVTPPDKDGTLLREILFCAKLAGATQIIKAGGSQGIAAAAFGHNAPGLRTPPAQLIIGPGNRYVTAAKSILASRGLVRIDSPAGPSEVLIIADHTARPDFVAADLLSQAEHGEDSAAVLCCLSRKFAQEVSAEIERGFRERPARRGMKEKSIRDHSFAIVFESLENAVFFSNEYAPEHLEICTENPEKVFEGIVSAGSVFLGHFAPVALGDYFSGTNHVLPTGRAAASYSGLGVDTFLKRITYQHPTRESLKEALRPIQVMSKVEGLEHEHGHSVEIRFH
jgi:histidinol dehydrogenase